MVVERGDLACGTSGKPIGGVRAQFSDPLNIELGAGACGPTGRFAHRPGADIRLDTVGYLFLLRTPERRRQASRPASGCRTGWASRPE